MEFWYGIVRNSFGKIRFKRVPVEEAATQDAFLKLMEFRPEKKDILVELDRGSHMSQDEFTSYVSVYYQNSKRVILSDMAVFLN